MIFNLKKRNDIRKKNIYLRNKLNLKKKNILSKKLVVNISKYLPIKHAKNIAIFYSVRGEINTKILINFFWEQKKNIYLPIIHPFINKQLLFILYNKDTNLIPNKFNIPEPELNISNLIPLHLLDIIFVPTIAFDKKGNRLGSGGGYYDRTFQNLKKYNFLLIGIAYDFQKVQKIKKENWDITLNTIITPSKIYEC